MVSIYVHSPSGILEGDRLTWIPSGNTEQLLPNRNGIVADLKWERTGDGTVVLPWLLSSKEGIHKSLYTPCERMWTVLGVERASKLVGATVGGHWAILLQGMWGGLPLELIQDLSEIQRLRDDIKSQSGVRSSIERPQILTMPRTLY